MYVIVGIVIFFMGIYALVKSRKVHYWQLKVFFSSWILIGPLIILEKYFHSTAPDSNVTIILQGLLAIFILFVLIWIWILLLDGYRKKQIPIELESKARVLLFAYPFILILIIALFLFLQLGDGSLLNTLV